MRVLKTGDPCPCCGKPIPMTDPDALRLLAVLADVLGLPNGAPVKTCGACDKAKPLVYTSDPPLYECGITGEYYPADKECTEFPEE